MNWSVYADLSRSLTEAERQAVADALDEVVPDGGCVGQQRGRVEDEVYFRLDAASSAEAGEAAARLLEVILQKAGIQARYELQLEPAPGK